MTLAGGLDRRHTSIREFVDQFSLSPEARTAISDELPTPALAEERFRFDFDEFNNQVGYRSLELDNGALVMAQSSEFDQVFHQEVLNAKEQPGANSENRSSGISANISRPLCRPNLWQDMSIRTTFPGFLRCR